MLKPRTLSPSGIRANSFGELVTDVSACVACSGMAHSHVLGAANGPLDARVLFIAEAVGRRGGAITGVPLTRDESGKRFSLFLEIAGIERSDVFITNAVLCNPVDSAGRNRPPTALEVARCRPFLARTIELVCAPIVVTLGRVALESLRAISPHDADLREDVASGVAWAGRTLVPMYHPSRQSTLHRPQAAQEGDWRRLGRLCQRLARFRDEAAQPGRALDGDTPGPSRCLRIYNPKPNHEVLWGSRLP